jgi:CMP-N,N'-diacetyllegionaminic acid synthase
MYNKKIICTICARKGSKGVKNKNIRDLLGKPLIAYSIEQAIATGLFEHVVISTDSDEIAEISVKFGAEVFFRRPDDLAGDSAAKIPVIRHALLESEKHYNQTFDVLVDLDATSPLRSVEDIKNAFSQFIENDNDIMITAMPSRRSPYFNLVEMDNNGGVSLAKKLTSPVHRRQDAPKCFDMNASIYIWKREALLTRDSLFSDRTGLYVMPEERSVDIDSELDFEFVQLVMQKRMGQS